MLYKLTSQVKALISSPNIDLLLNENEFLPGGKVTGFFIIKGGWFERKVSRLECDLVSTDKQKHDSQLIGAGITILMSEEIDSKELKRIPFSYHLPKQLSPSSDNKQYYFRTKLCFSDGDKSIDHDPITILNTPF
jgi:sporulation-control protein